MVKTEDMTVLLEKLGEYGINVEALLPVVMEWASTGVPLKYDAQGSTLKLYVDKEMVAPFMAALLPALEVLQKEVDKILKGDDKDTASLIQMGLGMLGIEKLTDIKTIWEENTDAFELSLNFLDGK